MLEPLHRRHHRDLWESAQGDEASFGFLGAGPFGTQAEMGAWLDGLAAAHDPMVWAVRAVSSGRVRGIAGLSAIRAAEGTIEVGPLWFGADLRRTRAGSEVFFLLLRLVFDELGYRRVGWRCDPRNGPACAAAERLGFLREGLLRELVVLNGAAADVACYGLLSSDWPALRNGLLIWMSADNSAEDGTAIRSLADCISGF